MGFTQFDRRLPDLLGQQLEESRQTTQLTKVLLALTVIVVLLTVAIVVLTAILVAR